MNVIQVSGLGSLLTNLDRWHKKADAVARNRIKSGADEIAELTEVTCAYDTGFMAEHVDVRMEESGKPEASIGWWEEDFLGAGLEFYPPYPELGTSRSEAQPSLFPAFEAIRPIVIREIGDDLAKIWI